MNFGWLQDKRIRFVAQALPSLLSLFGIFLGIINQVGFVYAILIAAIGALLLWIVANQIIEKASPQSIPAPPPQTERPKEPKPITPTLHPVCEVGPYKVEAGETLSILLNAKQGQKVKGHLRELDRQLFDWHLADEKNMILLENGDRYNFGSIDAGIDQNAYRVNRKIPYPARWYLILDMYGKKTSRKVRVDFEPIP